MFKYYILLLIATLLLTACPPIPEDCQVLNIENDSERTIIYFYSYADSLEYSDSLYPHAKRTLKPHQDRDFVLRWIDSFGTDDTDTSYIHILDEEIYHKLSWYEIVNRQLRLHSVLIDGYTIDTLNWKIVYKENR